jgi:hypothetical protein
VLLLLWLALSVAVWNVIFDLYVSRGAREYLQLQAEFQLGLGPEPAMAEVMRRNTRDGLWGASLWGGLVLVAVGINRLSTATDYPGYAKNTGVSLFAVKPGWAVVVSLFAMFGSAIYVAIELGRDGRRVRAR